MLRVDLFFFLGGGRSADGMEQHQQQHQQQQQQEEEEEEEGCRCFEPCRFLWSAHLRVLSIAILQRKC